MNEYVMNTIYSDHGGASGLQSGAQSTSTEGSIRGQGDPGWVPGGGFYGPPEAVARGNDHARGARDFFGFNPYRTGGAVRNCTLGSWAETRDLGDSENPKSGDRDQK